MATNGDPKLQKVVILSDYSDGEGKENDRSCKFNGSESSSRDKNEGNADQKENYVYRSLAEDYKIVADLTGYPHLAAMLAFEKEWKENRKKKNKKRKKKKKQKIEIEPENETKPEKMAANGDPKLQQVVILSDDSDNEGQKNGQSSKIDGTESSNHKKNEGNADQKENYVYRTLAEDYKIVADLTGYPHLAAMLAFEAKWKENRKKKNNKRKKKKQKIELEAQNEMVNEVGKEEERARNDVPHMLPADTAEEESQLNTSKAIETTIAFRADDDVRSVMLINLDSSSSERDEAIVDLGSPKSPGEGTIVGKDGKRIVAEQDNLYAWREGKQPETVEAVETTKELETESVPETESILPEKLLVKFKEGKKQADSSKDAERRIYLETESTERACNIGLQKFLGCTKQHGVAGGSQCSFLCYKCGGEGHFARECTKDFKIARSMSDFATPKRFPEKKKYILGFKSAPHDKACKRNMKYRKTMNMNQGQSGWNDRWDTVQPRNLSGGEVRANVWSPPASFDKNRQEIFTFTSYGQFASLQHPGGIFNRYTKPQSSQAAFTSYGQYTSPLHPRGVFNNYIEPRNSQAAFMSHGQYTSPLYPQGIFSHYTEPQSSQAYTSHLQHQGFGGH